MKLKTLLLAILLLFIFNSCDKNSSNINSKPERSAISEEMPANQNTTVADNAVERKLIKEGEVRFETSDANATREKIIKAVKKYKGYISSDDEDHYSGQITYTMVIRVPAKDFDNLLSESTEGVRSFDNKSVDVKDVTEEFLDVQARLKTKKALENRYLELLKKANTVSEILEVEKQIGNLRAEIESIEGRLKYLESQVSFSTLQISFYQIIPQERKFGNKFSNGFVNGWNNLIVFFVFLINVWPFILLIIAVIYGIKRWRRRKG